MQVTGKAPFSTALTQDAAPHNDACAFSAQTLAAISMSSTGMRLVHILVNLTRPTYALRFAAQNRLHEPSLGLLCLNPPNCKSSDYWK